MRLFIAKTNFVKDMIFIRITYIKDIVLRYKGIKTYL